MVVVYSDSNVEIQTTSSKNLPKRTRYYQGMIDLNAIEKGADYSEMPQSFVIFICTFDVFQTRIALDDQTTKIYE